MLKPVEVILRRGGRGRTMEKMSQTGYNMCIYGNVTTNPPAQLLCTNKKNGCDEGMSTSVRTHLLHERCLQHGPSKQEGKDFLGELTFCERYIIIY
jgi:hypothetical protein